MGIFKGTKVGVVVDEANAAIKDGRSVFVCRFNSGATSGHFSGSLGHVGEMIEAVEDAGWTLAEFSACDDRSVVGLFRR